MRRTIGIAGSGLCGLLAGIALAMLWHLVTLFILGSPYNGFWADVYAIIIDCSVGAILGTLGGIFIGRYCPAERRSSLLLGLASLFLSVPAVVWDASSFPKHVLVNGSALSFDTFTNHVWYFLLWGLPSFGIVSGFLGRRTLFGKAGIGLAIILIAYGFTPTGS